MAIFLTILVTCLFVNAGVSFFIAFFWQLKVILLLLSRPDPQQAFAAFLYSNSEPELRRKWGKAIAYVAFSYAALFMVAGLIEAYRPAFFD